jgi:outer membrane lipoprotein SlyB
MNSIQRNLTLTVVSLTLVLVTGCDTPSGALSGAAIGGVIGGLVAKRDPALGALIGVASGAIIGGAIGRINEQQRARLQAQSPQTWNAIQYNQKFVNQQPQSGAYYAPQQPQLLGRGGA